MITALNGARQYIDGAWQWKTGEYEPRVRSMKLSDLAPNFRCVHMDSLDTTVVEIPANWEDKRHWPDRNIDSDAASAIRGLLAGRNRSMIYAEGTAEKFNDHELKRPGYIVTVAEWDAALSAVIGCWWDKPDEQAILSKAQDVK